MQKSYEVSWSTHAHQALELYRHGLGRLAVAERLVRPGHRLLDVGCGDGTFSGLVSKRFQEVHGVDFSEVALARAAALGVITRQADLDKQGLPYPDESFDHVVCLDVIEHVIDPVHLLSECRRVLARRGFLLLTTINMRYLKFVLSLAVRGRFPRTSGDLTLYDGGHIHYFTGRDLVELMRAQALDVVQRRGVIGTMKLRWLVPLAGFPVVRDFLCTAIAVVARRPDS